MNVTQFVGCKTPKEKTDKKTDAFLFVHILALARVAIGEYQSREVSVEKSSDPVRLSFPSILLNKRITGRGDEMNEGRWFDNGVLFC
jgi:hypothetical protein